MTTRATTRRPADLVVGDVLYAGAKPARVVRVTATTVTARLGAMHFELKRRDLRRHGFAARGNRVFHLTQADRAAEEVPS